MATKNTDTRTQRIDSVERKLTSLQSGVRLTRLRDDVEDLGSTATRLKEWVRELRGRGYVFEKALAGDAADLERRWNALRIKVVRQIDKETASLEKALPQLERQLMRLSAKGRRRTDKRPLLDRVETGVDQLQEKVQAAERSIEGMYDKYGAEVDELTAHLRLVEWMLDQLAQAKFQLLPTEGASWR